MGRADSIRSTCTNYSRTNFFSRVVNDNRIRSFSIREVSFINIFTTQKISPVGKLNKEDLTKMGHNLVIFVAPTLAIFFTQLALGVDWRAAALVASLALYQALADFFKKLNTGK